MATKKVFIGHVKGADGEPGAPGKEGAAGKDGVTPEFTVTAQTTEEETASVDQGGTPPQKITLDFKIPRGPKGDKGDTPKLYTESGTNVDGAMTQKAVGDAITAGTNAAIESLKDLLQHPDKIDKGGYIGRRIEGGGTIFFDYAIGFKGDVTVAAKPDNLHTYHVDLATGMVVCDDPEAEKDARFYVVSDYDIGEYKHGTNLMWANGSEGKLLNQLVGTSTDFGSGYNNTSLCIEAAKTDGLLEWNANAYDVFWHYVWKGDWNARVPKWFVPSKDELNVLNNMQWHVATKRKSADGTVQLKQLPINFYSYYWSSSESAATAAHGAHFYTGTMYTDSKTLANLLRVRLVRTF